MKDSNIDLILGDSNIFMSNMIENSIDCIITDPPYGMNFQSNWSKQGPRYDVLKGDINVNDDWLKESYRILKTGGGILTFCDWKTSNEWKEGLEKAGFKIKSQVIWNRLHHGMGDLKGAFAPMHDIIWYAVKGRRIFANGRPKSVIECKRPSPSEDFGHPTCKPVGLMEKLIMSIDDGSNGVVLDPFMGSGSTGVACKKVGRSFIGIEIDENFYSIAKSRISEALVVHER